MDFLQKYEMFRQEKIISLITSDRSLATQKKKKMLRLLLTNATIR